MSNKYKNISILIESIIKNVISDIDKNYLIISEENQPAEGGGLSQDFLTIIDNIAQKIDSWAMGSSADSELNYGTFGLTAAAGATTLDTIKGVLSIVNRKAPAEGAAGYSPSKLFDFFSSILYILSGIFFVAESGSRKSDERVVFRVFGVIFFILGMIGLASAIFQSSVAANVLKSIASPSRVNNAAKSIARSSPQWIVRNKACLAFNAGSSSRAGKVRFATDSSGNIMYKNDAPVILLEYNAIDDASGEVPVNVTKKANVSIDENGNTVVKKGNAANMGVEIDDVIELNEIGEVLKGSFIEFGETSKGLSKDKEVLRALQTQMSADTIALFESLEKGARSFELDPDKVGKMRANILRTGGGEKTVLTEDGVKFFEQYVRWCRATGATALSKENFTNMIDFVLDEKLMKQTQSAAEAGAKKAKISTPKEEKAAILSLDEQFEKAAQGTTADELAETLDEKGIFKKMISVFSAVKGRNELKVDPDSMVVATPGMRVGLKKTEIAMKIVTRSFKSLLSTTKCVVPINFKMTYSIGGKTIDRVFDTGIRFEGKTCDFGGAMVGKIKGDISEMTSALATKQKDLDDLKDYFINESSVPGIDDAFKEYSFPPGAGEIDTRYIKFDEKTQRFKRVKVENDNLSPEDSTILDGTIAALNQLEKETRILEAQIKLVELEPDALIDVRTFSPESMEWWDQKAIPFIESNPELKAAQERSLRAYNPGEVKDNLPADPNWTDFQKAANETGAEYRSKAGPVSNLNFEDYPMYVGSYANTVSELWGGKFMLLTKAAAIAAYNYDAVGADSQGNLQIGLGEYDPDGEVSTSSNVYSYGTDVDAKEFFSAAEEITGVPIFDDFDASEYDTASPD